MVNKINASDAMIKVISDWGVDHIFGLPGGSFDSTMNALYDTQKAMKYIQVRHEEVGALAASGEAKLTGKIGVTFGSAGPGAVHLLNGLYDAKHDHVPVLALIGQVPSAMMNTHYFQEMNEDPIFEDVSVYNRTVMTPEQLPMVVDEAIREAYEHSGVATVIIPKDFGWAKIDDTFQSTADSFKFTKEHRHPELADVEKAINILTNAQRPLIFFGMGAKDAGKELKELSDKLKIPMISSAIAKGVIADSDPAYLGSTARVATKPGDDASKTADAILFVGTNMPFAGFFTRPDAKFIQVDNTPSNMGRRHHVDVGILADAKETLKMMVEHSGTVSERPYYDAMLADKKNWIEWLDKRAALTSTPLQPDAVFAQINRIADDNAIFAVDVGNVTIDSYRLLRMKPTQKIATSAWYATMGFGLPAAIGAKESYPDRQVFSISGDGGFAMVMQDVITQVKYHEPIINVVLSNDSLGFIEGEQEDKPQPLFGVDLLDANFGDAAKSLGAKGYEVRTYDELKAAFDEVKDTKVPVVIDVKISDDRPLPVENLILTTDENHTQADVDEFAKTYQTEGLISVQQLLKDYNVK